MAISKSTLYLRGKKYHLDYYENAVRERKALHTGNLQIAQELQRKLESELAWGGHDPLPTRTPLNRVVSE